MYNLLAITLPLRISTAATVGLVLGPRFYPLNL